MGRSGAASPLPVVCIGNFVAGGGGKTPTAIEIVALCRAEGLNPGFLTRGYGGREAGPLLVDPTLHGFREVGDEALLLARHAPTVVARRRSEGALLLAEMGLDLIVMDDGFQSPSLAKDLSLVVVDAARGIGNGRVMPAGPLRAPFRLQLGRADAVIVTGRGEAAMDVVRAASRAGLPVLRAGVVTSAPADAFRGKNCLAFAGIADPRKFERSLAETGANVERLIAFPDHHAFTNGDVERILFEADRRKLVPVTTEKDHVRLASLEGAGAARLREICRVLPVRMVFDDGRRMVSMIAAALEQRRLR